LEKRWEHLLWTAASLDNCTWASHLQANWRTFQLHRHFEYMVTFKLVCLKLFEHVCAFRFGQTGFFEYVGIFIRNWI
jgi:hypothetical protein